MIPAATKETNSAQIPANAFCGRSKGLISVAAGNAVTVCCKECFCGIFALANLFIVSLCVPARRTPFQLRFLSDGFEFANELTNPDRGFQLSYILTGTNC